MKIPRTGKCGILPCVSVFDEFASRAESIVMGTERRAELDKAYQQIIEALFKTVERAAVGHPKTPTDIIKFGRTLPTFIMSYFLLLLYLFFQKITTRLLVCSDACIISELLH
jgi:hypothetical protein